MGGRIGRRGNIFKILNSPPTPPPPNRSRDKHTEQNKMGLTCSIFFRGCFLVSVEFGRVYFTPRWRGVRFSPFRGSFQAPRRMPLCLILFVRLRPSLPVFLCYAVASSSVTFHFVFFPRTIRRDSSVSFVNVPMPRKRSERSGNQPHVKSLEE